MSELTAIGETDVWEMVASYGNKYDAIRGGKRHLRIDFEGGFVRASWETGKGDSDEQHAMWRGTVEAVRLVAERLKAVVRDVENRKGKR